jgi:hypothetical protein
MENSEKNDRKKSQLATKKNIFLIAIIVVIALVNTSIYIFFENRYENLANLLAENKFELKIVSEDLKRLQDNEFSIKENFEKINDSLLNVDKKLMDFKTSPSELKVDLIYVLNLVNQIRVIYEKSNDFIVTKKLLISLKDLIEKTNVNSSLRNEIKLHLKNDIRLLSEYEKNSYFKQKELYDIIFQKIVKKEEDGNSSKTDNEKSLIKNITKFLNININKRSDHNINFSNDFSLAFKLLEHSFFYWGLREIEAAQQHLVHLESVLNNKISPELLKSISELRYLLVNNVWPMIDSPSKITSLINN